MLDRLSDPLLGQHWDTCSQMDYQKEYLMEQETLWGLETDRTWDLR